MNYDHHSLLQEAINPETKQNRLWEIFELEDEGLNASLALNQSASSSLLTALSKLSCPEVSRNLELRYSEHPKLPTIKVREVSVDDAEYIYSLRTNSTYNKYISKVGDSVAHQREYLRGYIESNKTSREAFYYIFCRADNGIKCGTVRLYNFENDSFEWGSWILDENKTRFAAMETAIFIYEFAFKTLGFFKSEFEVNKKNESVVSYHLKSGARIISEDQKNYYFRITKAEGLDFAKDLRAKITLKMK